MDIASLSRQNVPTAAALGAVLLLAAALLVTGPGTVQTPAPVDLRPVTGKLVGAGRSCRRSGCWVELRIQTTAQSVDVTQKALPAIDAAYARLAIGDNLTATVAPPPTPEKPLGAEVAPDYFWGLERGSERLLTVKEATAESQSNARDWRTAGYVLVAGGALSLLGAVFSARLRALFARRPAL